jgi:hypothetical protein
MLQKIDKTLIGPAGEHLVLSRLLSAGFLAAPAPRGARKVDILVNFIDGGEPFMIQVKSTMTGARNGWWLSEKHEDLRQGDLFYCFVDFLPAQPDVYVLPAVLVADHVKKGHANWLATPGKDGGQHNDVSARRIDNKAQWDGRPEGWMGEFKERWDFFSR